MNSTSQAITLSYREGNSDKVYQVSIDETEGGFKVNYAYGRRGSTLKTGTKTQQPVSRDKAEKLFAKLVKAKEAKGYQHERGRHRLSNDGVPGARHRYPLSASQSH